MMRRCALLALALALIALTSSARADLPEVRRTQSLTPSSLPGPGPREIEQALNLVNAFVDCVSREDFVGAFGCVRGITDPKAADLAVRKRIQELVASRAYRDLSTCGANLETLGTALDAYGRANGWKLPQTLEALTRSAYLSEIPVCPAGGRYVYTDHPRNPRVVCSRDAHALIGVKGEFPALSLREGLSLGGQKLTFTQKFRFTVRHYTTTVAAYQPDFITLWIALEEESSLQGEPYQQRTGWFGLSRRDGEWKIDLFLTNQDLNGVFDTETWLETTAVSKQLLYVTLQTLPGQQPPDVERSAAFLLLKVCESNLRNLAVTVENASLLRNGRYPPTIALGTLMRRSHRTLLTCPAGGTYRYEANADGDKYRIFCSGHAHADADVPANLPSVDPVLGVTHQPSIMSPP